MSVGNDIKAGGAYIALTTDNSNFNKGINDAKKKLNGLSGAMKVTGQILGNSFRMGSAHAQRFGDGLRAIELKMRNFGVSARNLGLDLIKFGAALGTPLVVGVKQFANFEKSLAKVSTFLKGGELAGINDIKKQILSLSETFGVSAEKVAEGLSEILSADIPLKDAFGFLREGLKGSIGNAVEFKDQLHGLIAFTQAYGSNVLSAARATDILRVIVDKGIAPAGELGREIGNVASAAAEAGISAEELASAYAVITQKGISVAETTTAIKSAISQLGGSSPEAAANFRKLSTAVTGVDTKMSLATIRSLGLLGVLELLEKASPDDLNKIFPNERAFKGSLILTKNLEKFKEALDAARGSTGASQTAYDKMTKTLAHLGSQLLETGRNMLIGFGEILLTTLTSVAHALIDITKIVSVFIKQNPELIILLSKITIGVVAVGGALIATALVFSTFSTILGGIVAVGSSVFAFFGVLGSMFTGLAGFILSPIGAIVAFGAIILSTFVDLGGAISSVWEGAKKGFKGIADTFKSFKDGIMRTFEAVKAAITVKDYDLAVKIIVNKIKLIWFEAVDGIQNRWGELKTWFKMTWNEIALFSNDFVNGMIKKLGELTNLSIFGSLKELFNDTFNNMDGTLEGFAQTWASIWTKMQQAAIISLGMVERGLFKTAKFGVKAFGAIAGVDTSNEARKKRAAVRVEIEKLSNERAKLESDLGIAGDDLTALTTKGNDPSSGGSLGMEKIWAIQKRILETDKEIKALNNSIGGTLFANIDKELDAYDKLIAKSIELQDARVLEKEDTLQADIITKELEKQLRLQNEFIDNYNEIFDNQFAQNQLLKDQEKLAAEGFEKANAAKLAEQIASMQDLLNFLPDPDDAIKGSGIADLLGDDDSKKEAKKITDGIMGAFNTNALGDFSGGDVADKQLKIAQKSLKLDESIKEALDYIKSFTEDTAENTKKQARFQ